MQLKDIVVAAALLVTPGLLHAQFDFKVAGRTVQVHSFASQGFVYSNQNNFLTMKTSDGTAAFSDVGLNVSTSLSDKFRVGAQVYDRNMGKLGNWQPTLDWAVADYRFKDWFGIRGGKVKSTVGLYNDTQDMGFLHTWALLPQSTYPADFRADYIAHVGGDIYGSIGAKKAGTFNYTLWGGKRQDDPEGGMKLAYADYAGGRIEQKGFSDGRAMGVDLRWSTPVNGLLVGASLVKQGYMINGPYTIKPSNIVANLVLDVTKHHTQAYYVQYSQGKLRLDGEYRKTIIARISNITGPIKVIRGSGSDAHYGYVAAAYRLSNLIEVGSYHSRMYPVWGAMHMSPSGHIFDTAVTGRFDLRSYLDVKVEGHFMDGYGDASTLRTFYPSDNPQGLKPKTNLFIVRLEYHL